MKCIKATKTTKQFKTGDIKRVSDKEAISATSDGYWVYVPKSEWKSKVKPEANAINDQITDSVTTEKNKKSK